MIHAHRIATPVLHMIARSPGPGVVRGGGPSATYIDFDGFVVALTARDVPLMPNGVALTTRSDDRRRPSPGAAATLHPGLLRAGPEVVVWAPQTPPVWDPSLPVFPTAGPAAIRRRGAAILAACGIETRPDPPALARALVARGVGPHLHGIELLLRSLASRRPEHAADAAAWLIGRGPGLTPEGDDLITATSAVIATLASSAGWTPGEGQAWLEAIGRDEFRASTTGLSATLIELAGAGEVIEPLHGLLNLGPGGERQWPPALRCLTGIGGSTGMAYGVAAGAAALLCST